MHDFSNEAVGILQNGKPVVASIAIDEAAGATKVNPTTFEDMGNTVSARSVAPALLSQQFGLAWNSGLKLESIVESNVNALCDKMIDVVSGIFTTTNFGALNNFDITGAITADAKDNLFQDIFALLDKGNKRVLFANSTLYAKGAPINLSSFDPTAGGKIRGFDGFHENTYLNGNLAGIKGVVTDGRGVAIVSRLPEWYDAVNELLEQETLTLDKLGLSVQFNKWASTNTRSGFASLDVVFGAGKYDATATKLIGQTEAQQSQETPAEIGGGSDDTGGSDATGGSGATGGSDATGGEG